MLISPANEALQRKLLADESDPDSAVLRTIRDEAVNMRAAARARRVDIDAVLRTDADLHPALIPGANRIIGLFNRLSFSAAYDEWEAQRTAELAAHLAADENFRAALSGWSKADSNSLLAAARLMGDAQRTIFCRDTLAKPPQSEVTWLAARESSIGRHQSPREEDGRHRLLYRVDPKSPFRDRAEGVGTVFHENLHMIQSALAFAFARGALDGHPLHRDARLHFMTLLDDAAYLPGIESLYLAHPAERDAWKNTPLFVETLRTALAPHGLKL